MPPIPSKETGDRKARPSRLLLGSGGQENSICWRTACSIRGDMTGLAWWWSPMTEVAGWDAEAASAPESDFPLANSP